ncbi:UNVERIFIED_ORG: hypothetical protein ABIC62_006128 [Burkholderia sp. 1595]|uniref:Uncharacterized protein n=1 Tax=Paraburkholderia terricola TaxID=169427 RepID=A0ABU1M1N1_9BURK|nr:hypothetical protein [Paraburkholderia terricola]MDR6412774.1 hypothetical protein [Paraburkholderia terricola]
MLDIVLATLKILAILSTGILGAIGLLVDFKVNGEITVWGRRALIGSIISTMVAVMTQFAETYQSEEESRRKSDEIIATQRTNDRLLRQIKRGLYPIEEISFYAVIRFNKPPIEAQRYVSRLRRYARDNARFAESQVDDNFVLIEGDAQKLQPDDDVANEMLRPDFIIRIFKSEKRARCFWAAFPYVDQKCYADLTLKSDAGENRSVSLGLKTGKVLLYIRNIRATVHESEGNEVSSLLDLSNALVFVSLRIGDNDDRWISDLLGTSQLEVANFAMGTHSLPLSRTQGGLPSSIFEGRLPESEDQLLRPTIH